MDSVTQACVGAVVGEIAFGRELGWRAAAWGAVCGSLPDLDILAMPVLDDLTRWRWHRGWSHALPGLLLCSGIGTVLLCWRTTLTWQRVLPVALICVAVNILLDCLNVYGTQLYAPFSDQRVMWNLLFIIDPLFTVPLILGLIAARCAARWQPVWRQRLIIGAVCVSVAYLTWAVINKIRVTSTFADVLALHDIMPDRWITTPTPLNTMYWRMLAEVDGAYVIAYATVGDVAALVPVAHVPRQAALLDEHRDNPHLQEFFWSSCGYWCVREDAEHGLLLIDLRFGDRWLGRPGKSTAVNQGVWAYAFDQDGVLRRQSPDMGDSFAALSFIWARMTGSQLSGL